MENFNLHNLEGIELNDEILDKINQIRSICF